MCKTYGEQGALRNRGSPAWHTVIDLEGYDREQGKKAQEGVGVYIYIYIYIHIHTYMHAKLL